MKSHDVKLGSVGEVDIKMAVVVFLLNNFSMKIVGVIFCQQK